ncbi:MAG: hypothetical protein ACYTGZ_07485 [Planctomycetota bacterium]|jgi:hypothetical protein
MLRLRVLLLLLAGFAIGLTGSLVWADDDDEESVIEVESEPDDEPETKKDTPPGKKKGTPRTKKTAKGDKTIVQDGKKRFTIELPAEWEVREVNAKDRMASFDVTIPGADSRARLEIEIPVSAAVHASGLPYNLRLGTKEKDNITQFRILSKVLPHATFQQENGGRDSLVVRTFPAPRGRVLYVTLVAAPDEFDRVYEPFLAAAKSTTYDKPAWPEIPKAYKTVKKGRFVFATHDAVRPPTKHVVKTTGTVLKRFTKLHGKLPKVPRDAGSPVIFIHTGNTQAKSLEPSIKEDGNRHINDYSGVRFLTVAVQPDDRQETANLHSGLAQFFLYQRYGTAVPLWVRWGEARAAAVEYNTEKKLPYMHTGFADWASGMTLPPIDKMTDEAARANNDGFGKQAFFYVAFFRCGPSTYRKAYRAMLQDIADNYDPEAAAKRHLESIGYDNIQAAASKFMHGKIKWFTPK